MDILRKLISQVSEMLLNLFGLASSELGENGVSNIIYTDIERDGRPTGPNIDMCERILSKTEINLNVAGGISSIDDVLRLKEIGAHGAIIGRAIYTSDIDLTEALRIGDEG